MLYAPLTPVSLLFCVAVDARCTTRAVAVQAIQLLNSAAASVPGDSSRPRFAVVAVVDAAAPALSSVLPSTQVISCALPTLGFLPGTSSVAELALKLTLNAISTGAHILKGGQSLAL